jgi:hypothetical protein
MDNKEATTYTNPMLCAGILGVLKEDWSSDSGDFYAYWYGYDALEDCLLVKGIETNLKELKNTMKELEKQKLVKIAPHYNSEFKLSGRGWFACT